MRLLAGGIRRRRPFPQLGGDGSGEVEGGCQELHLPLWPRTRRTGNCGDVGITERAAQKIVAELEAAEVSRRSRVGRRARCVINRRAKLRHPIAADRTDWPLVCMGHEAFLGARAARPLFLSGAGL